MLTSSWNSRSPAVLSACDPTSVTGGNCLLTFGCPQGLCVVLSTVKVSSLKVGLMSDAFNNRAWMAAADAPEDEEDDDDFDELLELFEELLVLFDEDDDDDDGLELDVAA